MHRIFAGVLVALALAPTGAAAHDHRPPDALLRGKGSKQEGIRVTSCWIRGKDLGGAAFCEQQDMSFPEPVGSRPSATVVLETPRQPSRVRVRTWRRLKENGQPRRPSRRLEAAVQEVEQGWAVRIALPRRDGIRYLEVKGVWRDARFPDSRQFAVWTFAVRGGRAPAA